MKRSVVILGCAILVFALGSRLSLAADAREQARNHYETGLTLFDAGDREQALVEFGLAYNLFPSNDVVFMLAQCEYHMGRLNEARAHYERYLADDPKGPLAERSRLRIAAIDRRPSVFVINTVPSDVAVAIKGEGQNYTGQAPNEFPVPKGTYRIIVSRPNYQSQERTVTVGVAETHPLFFKLDPVPGRLIIKTNPARATLYVRGMRAENPYNQRVEPGVYEVFAEADNHESRRETVEVRAGQDTLETFELTYVQRNGRSDLITTWGIVGAVAAVGWVTARVGNVPADPESANPASISLLAAAAGVGAVAGGVLGARMTPDYIPDNRSMYRIGAMTVGALQGTLVALSITGDLQNAQAKQELPSVFPPPPPQPKSNLPAGLVGGGVGLLLGSALGIWTDARAPSFGRVTLIQSAAVAGALAGFLAAPAFDFARGNTEFVALAGLNLGLAAGLAGAYLGDQSKYGPSWQRVILIDLTVAAGVFGGAVVGTIPGCTATDACKFKDTPTTTKLALAGGAIGLVAGWLLTDGMDTRAGRGQRSAANWLPSIAALPTATSEGSWGVTPGLAAQGRF